MKKIVSFVLILLTGLLFSGCMQKNVLLVLNWGEYINEDVVTLFEEEYGVRVIMSIADSNELFYSKVKSGTTAYDLVVPSDYMIEKMYLKGLIQEIDLDRLENYDLVNNPLMPGIVGIQGQMFEGNERYAVPYFWGTFGLMYNKNKVGLEEAVQTHEWKAFFETSKAPVGTKVGMYDVPRFAYAAALMYNDLSPNLATEEALVLAETTLSMRKFDEWGTDTLKKGISAGNLDLAFVYTGDFLDALYIKLENESLENIAFDIHIPNNTLAFMDAFVIPTKARHVDLAHQFIDFLLRPDMAYLNASVVGYCTPLQLAYDEIVSYVGDDEWLNAWAYATQTYYPLPAPEDPVQFKGTPIANLDRTFLNQINTMVFNVIVRMSR